MFQRRSFSLLASLGLAAAAHAGTVFSDDFSSSLAGGAASSSDYTLVGTGSHTSPPDYRVISNPGTDFTNSYASYYDHTQGTASGAMLFFDGAGSASTRIYDHDVNLTAGTTYTISYWGSAGGSTSVPVLDLAVNGVTLGTSLTTVSAQWQQSTATFTPTTTGLYTLSVFDANTVDFGNDGAIDDFLVTTPSPTPEPSALAALGLGAAAVLRRRKR